MDAVTRLTGTSADDCKISLLFITDLDLLQLALAKCQERGHATKAKYIISRIRTLERSFKGTP